MAVEDIKFVNPVYGIANEEVNKTVNYVYIAIISITLLLLFWANVAKIDEYTSGEGKVIPSSKIQKIQYLDNGIVTQILIKEGIHVSEGDALMKIDTTRFQASFEENQETIYSLQATKTRLEKELNTNYKGALPKLDFSKELSENGTFYIQNQRDIFKNRFYERRNTLKVLTLQYKQRKQELAEVKSKYKQLQKSIKLVKEQLRTTKKLVQTGTKSNVELLDMQKELNSLEGDLSSAKLSIPRTELAIEEVDAQIKEKVQAIKSEVAIELQKTQSELKTIQARLVTDEDKLAKTVITSPVNGTIKSININTIGGVVQSGMDLIEIVPDSNILLIEAKIDPKDIAFINPSQEVIVKLTSYDFSIYGGLEAKIVEISADSIKDEDSKDGKSYYKVVVKTDKNFMEHNGKKLPIIPGMVATVDIVTGEKTIMDFILKPILKVTGGALHER